MPCILAVVLMATAASQDPKLADPHPIVAGFERFGADDPVEGGRLLIGELNCVACHRSDAAIDAKKAPLLTDAGSRFRADWRSDCVCRRRSHYFDRTRRLLPQAG